MLKRQRSGSVVCRSCGLLVGVNDPECFNCGARNPGLWGYAPLLRRLGQDLGFTNLVTGGCIILYLATLAVDPRGIRMDGLFGMLGPSSWAMVQLGASGAFPVFGMGRWWTVLSAAWLHGGLLHILFNLLWVRQLSPATADIYGASRTIIIYTASSVVGFGLTSAAGLYLGRIPLLGGAGLTVGASAPIFGLLGALVYSGRRGGSSAVSKQAQGYAIILFLFGVMMPGVDNWAHLGGFLGGFVAAQILDPLKPERFNHLVLALLCLGATGLAILLSLLDRLPG